jgi:hypothetical protein
MMLKNVIANLLTGGVTQPKVDPSDDKPEPGNAVARVEDTQKLLREIRDYAALSRATDGYTDAGRYLAEAATANVDYDQEHTFVVDFPYVLVPAQPRTILLYANHNLYPFMLIPANTPATAVYPRLKILRIVALATPNPDAVIVEVSSREYKVDYDLASAVTTIPSDTLPNPPNGAPEEVSLTMLWDGAAWRRARAGATGLALVSSVSTATAADGSSNTLGLAQNSAGTQVAQLIANEVYNGATWDRLRTPTTFKTASVTALGNTALWTPGAGKKFRVMRFKIDVTAQVAAAAGATLVVGLQDAATDISLSTSVFVPAASVTTGYGAFTTGWLDLGNGYLSTAANNVLNVNLSSALTAGAVRVTVCGTEE